MKKILIFWLWFILSLNVRADTPDLDRTTNIVTFSRVTVDKKDIYTDVELLLSPSGSWKVLTFNRETGQENELKINGHWKSLHASGALCTGSFATPMGFEVDLLLIQRGSKVIGFEHLRGRVISLYGEIEGKITGKEIAFKRIQDNELPKNYIGIISDDYNTLTFNSDLVCGEGDGASDLVLFLQE